MRLSLAAIILEILSKVYEKLPKAIRFRLIQWIGRFYAFWPHPQRRVVRSNLAQILGLSGKELNKTSRAVFQHFGHVFFDFLAPSQVTFEAPVGESLEKWRAQYGGLLVLTFHIGGWELGGHCISDRPGSAAVFQRYENPRFRRLIEARRPAGVNLIPVGEQAGARVREALRDGQIVAMLADIPYGETGTWVEVNGRRVRWAKGPVLLAVREVAPIIIGAVIRTGASRYRVDLQPPIVPRNRTLDEARRITQAVADKFGMLLQNFPTQWCCLRPIDVQPSTPAVEKFG